VNAPTAPLRFAIHHEFLTEDLDSMRQVLQFGGREANRLRIAMQIFAARCAGTDMGEFYVFLGHLAMEVSTVSCGQIRRPGGHSCRLFT
jgi:hypothetical protein